MIEKIKVALEKLFLQHRLVFWYDDEGGMKDIYEKLVLDGVQKLLLTNNEFGTKYRILIEEPESRFLIYQSSPKPIDAENWLLDLNLAYYEFHTEPAALYLQELGLQQEFLALIQAHEDFFAKGDYLQKLKATLEEGDRESRLRIKMLSVLCNCEPEWEKTLYSLFDEVLKNQTNKMDLINNYKLNQFFWDYIEKKYGYKEIIPSIKDLAAKLMINNFQRALPKGKPSLSKNAYIFVNQWKENSKAQMVFEELSRQISTAIGVANQVDHLNAEDLLDVNTFTDVDKKILVGLRDHLINQTISNQSIQEWIDKRRTKYFFKDYKNIYNALSNGSLLLSEIRKIKFEPDSLKNIFITYTKQYQKIDYYYRKYIFYSEHAEHQNLLKDLTQKIEKAYTNSYLLPLADLWQKGLDTLSSWEINEVEMQRNFYRKYVKPFADKGNRIFVIISDGLRYESAVELREIIIGEDRYSAEIHSMLSTLPSYTQLGMASLLPHKDLSFCEDDDYVLADGGSTKGTDNRTKVLQKAFTGSIAMTAEDFLALNAHEGREYIKPYQIVYIYHNGIDKIGDDKVSEHKVFDAVENEFDIFIKLMKQIANMNGTNMLITSDHGFLYQHDHLSDSDFNDFAPEGASINKISRRYVIGKNLSKSETLMFFTSSQLGLTGDYEVIIPKSINRLRVQGAGSRFVHGGASLQEVVIPVIEINKKRKSDIDYVDIDVLGGSKNITSNQFGINFYQRQPIVEKMQPRQIIACFYSNSNKPISDSVILHFNSEEKDSAAREKRHVFTFVSDAIQYNNLEVELRLEEPIEGMTIKKLYQRHQYHMMISFGSEFDE